MRLFLLILACLLPAIPVWAQTPPAIDPAVVQDLVQARSELHQAQPGPDARQLSDAQIKAKLGLLPDARNRLSAALVALTPHLQDLDARLAQLGPAPGPGQPAESPTAADARQRLTAARGALDSEVKLARLMSVTADQTAKTLSKQLSANFSARLWTRSRSIADPDLWTDLAQAAPGDFAHLLDAASGEGARIAAALGDFGRAFSMLFGVLAAFTFFGPARVLLNRLGVRRANRVAGGRLRSSTLAVWLTLVAVVTPLLGGDTLRLSWLSAGALTPDLDDLARLAIRSLVFAALLEGLGRALLSPRRPALRLAPLSDELVNRIALYPGLVGAAAGLADFVAGLNASLGSSLATSVASDCATLLLEMLATGGALLALAHVQRARIEAASEPAKAPEAHLPWVASVIGAWLALAGVLIAVLSGYLALATFLMRETVWIGAVLAMLALTVSFFDDLFPVVLSDKSAAGRAVRAATGLSEPAMEQIAVLASGLVRLGLLALAAAAIVAPFGADIGDVLSRIGQLRFQLKIGQVVVSPASILGAFGLLLAGLLITRAVRSWLEREYLPKTEMDIGVRTSLATAVSYVGVVFAVILAFAYLGLSFSQIALFASALSVGIGFGLQSIIGNFVSGLILLAERPIKVGDWVAIGDLEGDVRAINIRATEIVMADHSRLIVPNSDLVSKTVRNVTYVGALGRVRIVLRVDDSADPAEVRETILKRLDEHQDVLSEPPASVYLTDVRDGALEFTAFAYVTSPRYAFRVKSELLFRIVPDLKAKGIALASSSTVVNVGFPDRPIEPTADPRSP